HDHLAGAFLAWRAGQREAGVLVRNADVLARTEVVALVKRVAGKLTVYFRQRKFAGRALVGAVVACRLGEIFDATDLAFELAAGAAGQKKDREPMAGHGAIPVGGAPACSRTRSTASCRARSGISSAL